ncbi:MAG: arsenate reductase ArsC [Pseudobdellovibrionaceae bacterium]
MNILFMCVANSARSQLAEGLARQTFPDAKIMSAGSHPGKLNPVAVTVMNEIEIDISKHYSKSIDDLPPKFVDHLDYIITVCAEEVCPTVVAKNAKRLHWPFPDPASKGPVSQIELLLRFREVRNNIQKKLKEFKAEIET